MSNSGQSQCLFYQISTNAPQIMEIVHKYAIILLEAISVHVVLATNLQQTTEPVLVRIYQTNCLPFINLRLISDFFLEQTSMNVLC